MSHFTRIKTQMVEKVYIMQALDDLGYKADPGEKTITGEGGRSLPVEFKIPVGQTGYSIGFRKEGDTYEILANWYGIRGIITHKKFQEDVTQRYAYHAARAKLEQQGFTLLEEQVEEDGRIHLVLRRTA